MKGAGFRCAGWRDSIHLGLRRPGEELLHINTAEPLFWEIIFLFGAIGLPVGVFHWTVDPLFQRLKQGLGGLALASGLGGLSWPLLYTTLIVLYVAIHYLFVSQTSQVLALFGVFLDVGTRGHVPLPLMAFGLLFASSYFSVITPQGGSQNIIFAASGYLTQRELYRLGLLVTLAFLAVFLLIGSPWVYLVTR